MLIVASTALAGPAVALAVVAGASSSMLPSKVSVSYTHLDVYKRQRKERKEVINMAKSNNEVTSAKAASAASKVLSNPKSSPAAKTAAASALTQRPNKK